MSMFIPTRILSSSTLFLIAAGPLVSGCASDNDAGSLFTDSGAATLSGTDDSGSGSNSGDGDGDGSPTGDGDGDGEAGDGDGDGTGGIKLDTLPPDSAGDGSTGDEGCSFVDLLFVIDNSVSMGGYQAALGLAFPQFADTLVAALPPGTNVHVAVTSSEMGYASSGSTMVSNGVCTFIGDGMPGDSFYITPDQQNTGKNGAQGRLFDPGGGQPYFEFDTDDNAGIAALETWFSAAAAVGTGGSNIEMTCAPAGWAFDPANDATNAGFVRDEGAVLVIFFMTDEPDQTPALIGGTPGGEAMLAKVAAAKSGCGGLDCVLGGGFLLESVCQNQPLDGFLAGLPETAQVAPLPPSNLPAADAAAQMNALLADTLADVIAAKCDEIPPVG